MRDTIRDAPLGQIIHRLSGGRFFPYPEELPGFVIPERFLAKEGSSSEASSISTRVVPGNASQTPANEKEGSTPASDTKLETDAEAQTEQSKGSEQVDPYLVDWYGPDDQANPQNWSFTKKSCVLLCIFVLTFTVYIGAAIYTASIANIKETYGATNVVATLGLTLYVFMYGVGPMFLSPLQELPILGRNPIYVLSLLAFVLLQLGVTLVDNVPGIMVLRAATGFMASPALATGGATLGDIYAGHQMPYVLGIWAMAATVGPTLGPLLGNYAAEANGWRWPMWELFWASAFSGVWLFLLLPETLPDHILLRRAQRLRKLTGNEKLRSKSEIKQSQMTVGEIAKEHLLRPFQLMIEPAVLVLNTYIGLTYAIFYLWFEAFPLVFGNIYHFSPGSQGLAYLGLFTTSLFCFPIYYAWNKYYLFPMWARTGKMEPEDCLLLACFSGFIIPISLFIFGWTSRESSHWIGPVIGAALYTPGIYLLFQCGFIYLPQAYPAHVASVFAANAFFRCALAAVFPLIGKFFYDRLGFGGGCSFLAGISLLMIPALYVIMKKGAYLRSLSKYATSQH